MTKEDLLERTFHFSHGSEKFIKLSDIQELFDSNICIPKGVNRHSYADELHLMLEGIETEMQLEGFIPWIRCDIKNVRIKPSEPTYEWQWVCQEHKGTEFFVPVGWHTFEELQPSMYSLGRLEETKRVRQ